VRLMTLAQQRGLFVSPHLPAEDFGRAQGTQCELHLPAAWEAKRTDSTPTAPSSRDVIDFHTEVTQKGRDPMEINRSATL